MPWYNKKVDEHDLLLTTSPLKKLTPPSPTRACLSSSIALVSFIILGLFAAENTMNTQDTDRRCLALRPLFYEAAASNIRFAGHAASFAPTHHKLCTRIAKMLA